MTILQAVVDTGITKETYSSIAGTNYKYNVTAWCVRRRHRAVLGPFFVAAVSAACRPELLGIVSPVCALPEVPQMRLLSLLPLPPPSAMRRQLSSLCGDVCRYCDATPCAAAHTKPIVYKQGERATVYIRLDPGERRIFRLSFFVASRCAA
jgi:hypothetical protein